MIINSELDKSDLRKADFLSKIVYCLFKILEQMIEIRNVNYPNIENKVIFAMWHSDQCALHGIPYSKREKVNVLISKSLDGEIIARVVEKIGFKTVRGSENTVINSDIEVNKGGRTSYSSMIDKINEGENVAIMVDGPGGPLHKVKNGVVRIAKYTGAIIIPVVWYSPNLSFLHLPSWDKMTFPVWFTKIVNVYGEPIYVSKDATKEDENNVKEHLKNVLNELSLKAPQEWKKAYNKI